MEVEAAADWPGRWSHLSKLLERRGPLTPPSYSPSPDILPFILENIKILVIGAGGLGCELLKNLGMMGFRNIDVIDMDTIDLSNLNRQFLFRQSDVGKFKAQVAAECINRRIPGCRVTPHNCKIQDYDADFYSGFHLVVCGLDSVVARRWINGMLLSLLDWDEEGELDKATLVPLIDGGTEGFKGNARVIYPGVTTCIDCTLDLFPPQVNFPLCTIAHTPRLPEHCVEFARLLLWPKDKPFGEDTSIDGDDPAHISWIYERARERAEEYGIQGVTYRLTQGVVKHIIPAVASTNAVIAAACTTEVFKVVTSCAAPLANYMVFNDTDGIYTYVYEQERSESCPACSRRPQKLEFPSTAKLQEVVDHLVNSATFQMRAPGLTTSVEGRNKTLYMQSVPSIEAATRPNLRLTLAELGLVEGSEVVVADSTSPSSIVFHLKLT